MRGECAICGRGAEFPRAWLFLIGVYRAHQVYLTEFSSLRPNVRDFPAGYTGIRPPCRRACQCFPFRIASWLVCPIFPTVRGWILDFVELCNILYTAGPSTFEFALWQMLAFRFSCKVAREILAFHWTLQWNNSITEPTTSTQARTRIAHVGVGTLNQSTSQVPAKYNELLNK